MTNVILFALLGLGTGALIAGLALSVILQYRGSGTVDVSIGAVAMMGAYVFFGLHSIGKLFLPIPFVPAIDAGGVWSVWPSLLVTVAICVAFGAFLSAVVFRRVRLSSPVAKLVVTLGVLLSLQGMVVLDFGSQGQGAPNVLPSSNVALLGTNVPVNRFILGGIVIAVTLALEIAYRRTRFGLATRAAAENEEAAILAGLAPQRITAVNTVAAYALAGVLGVLVAPTTTLDPTVLALTIIPALGAALIARFTSFGLAAVAGLAMGVIQSEITYLQSKSWFPAPGGFQLAGVADLVYFLIVVAALLWRGTKLPQRGARVEQPLPPAPRPERITRPVTGAAVLGFVLLMVLPFDFRQALTNTLIGVVLCLSLVVITGFAGQISLIQTALAGTAGFLLYHLAQSTGIGFPIAPLIAIVGATAFGMVAAVPALRVRGVHLAIVTLAAAVALENFGFQNPTWGQGASVTTVPPPRLLGLDLGQTAGFPGWDGKVPSPVFGLLCLAIAIALGVLVVNLRRGLLGQRMLAVRSNERAAAAVGISIRTVKIVAFAIGSMIAGTAGTLYAYNFGSVTADRFSIVNALNFIATAFIGGITTVTGAIFGGMLVPASLPGYAFTKWTGLAVQYQQIVGGLTLIVILTVAPEGLALAHSAGRAPHNYIIKLIALPFRKLRASRLSIVTSGPVLQQPDEAPDRGLQRTDSVP